MAVPTAALDKGQYQPGDTATLTVTRDKGTLDVPVTVAGVQLDVHAEITAPVQVGGTYAFALQHDDGTTAVYTTTV